MRTQDVFPVLLVISAVVSIAVSAVYDIRLCLFLGISLLALASIVRKAVHEKVRKEFGRAVPLFLMAASAVCIAAFIIFPQVYSPERLAFLVSVVLVVAAGRAVAVGRRARTTTRGPSGESQ